MAKAPKKFKPPAWLDDTAKEEWKRIEKILREEEKDFTTKDLKALEAYCTNYSKWLQAEKVLQEKGLVFRCSTGYTQQRAEVAIANKAQAEVRAWASELGLTPKSRAKMYKIDFEGDGEKDKEMEGYVVK